jgi:hypothetical protein
MRPAVAAYSAQYNPRVKSAVQIKLKEADAIRYFVKHKLALMDMQKLLLNASFEEKYSLMEAIKVAERKAAFWERHQNFNLQSALIVLRAARKISL